MRSSLILASLIAPLALANPVQKRHVKTEVEMVTVWTTVTRGYPQVNLPSTSTSTQIVYSTHEPEEGGYHDGGRMRPSPDGPVAPSDPAPTPSDPAPTPSDPAPAPSDPAPAPSDPAPAPSDPAPSDPAPSDPAPAPPSDPAAAPPSDLALAPPSDPAPALSLGPDSSYAEQAVYQHNVYRRKHVDTNDYTWNQKLADAALKLANRCKMEHDIIDADQFEGGYGQNIGWNHKTVTGFITSMYENEMPNYEGLYGQENPTGARGETGHFTAIVWRSSKEVGCATSDCANGPITVCNYSPAGNFVGRYAENVGKPIGRQ